MSAIKAIVTDIEGTTSSLSFVKDILFPYARARLADFVSHHHGDPEVTAILEQVRHEAGQRLDLEGVVTQLTQWLDEDRKIGPLKALQGLIWENGYRQGDFTGHVYDDAVRNLRRWHADGIKLYVFSSGSVKAQQLLYSHTEFGDLTPLFSGYFDTRIGAKGEPAAYRHICQETGLAPDRILFLSDVVVELDAAAEVGFQTRHLVRDGSGDNGRHCQVAGFDEISLDAIAL